MLRVIEAAENILQKYGGKDVMETAENSGARVWFRPLGSLKGFYIRENGVSYIVVNEALDDVMKRVVCAHELGHDVLHRELSESGIRESTVFLETNRTELEANLFAACVLLSDEELLDAVSDGADIDCASSRLCLPREIVKYKLTAMNAKGYNFTVGDIRNDFLK